MAPPRGTDRTPVFQVLTEFQSDEPFRLDLPGVEAVALDAGPDKALTDLTVYFTDRPEGIRCHLEYNAQLFDQVTVDRFFTVFRDLLTAAVERPGTPLSLIARVPAEGDEVPESWGRGPLRPVLDATVHDWVARQAAENPGRSAVGVRRRRVDVPGAGRGSGTARGGARRARGGRGPGARGRGLAAPRCRVRHRPARRRAERLRLCAARSVARRRPRLSGHRRERRPAGDQRSGRGSGAATARVGEGKLSDRTPYRPAVLHPALARHLVVAASRPRSPSSTPLGQHRHAERGRAGQPPFHRGPLPVAPRALRADRRIPRRRRVQPELRRLPHGDLAGPDGGRHAGGGRRRGPSRSARPGPVVRRPGHHLQHHADGPGGGGAPAARGRSASAASSADRRRDAPEPPEARGALRDVERLRSDGRRPCSVSSTRSCPRPTTPSRTKGRTPSRSAVPSRT
ncbi:hypothetical protein SMICM304S_09816 [Streptomyces microflavus]